MRSDDPRIQALYARFAQRLRNDADLLQAAARGEAAFEDVLVCLHKLAGAAGTFGLCDLSAAASELDNRLRECGLPGGICAEGLDGHLHRIAQLCRDGGAMFTADIRR